MHAHLHVKYLEIQSRADLWGGLLIRNRYVDGAEDVTFGGHPQLGIGIVNHYGFENCTRWITREPIDSIAAIAGAVSVRPSFAIEDGGPVAIAHRITSVATYWIMRDQWTS